jgi:hypothetical protein
MKIFNRVTVSLSLLLCITIDSSGQKHPSLYLQGKESDNDVFVITKDSVKHSGKKFKWPPSYFATSEYIAIDGVRYSRKKKSDIIAYQNETAYYVYLPSINDDISRLRKGKINLYTQIYFSGISSGNQPDVYTFYLVEKEKNNFLPATWDNLEKVFSDNPAVLQKYHEIYPDRTIADVAYTTKNTHKVKGDVFENMILLVEMYNKN